MSWFRSAINKAAEAAGAGGKSFSPNFSKVRNYAGAVVQKAGDVVAGGAKIVFERAVSGRNLNNFQHAVQRLEEVSLYSRGRDRTDALMRWLKALQELEEEENERQEGRGAEASKGPAAPQPAAVKPEGGSPKADAEGVVRVSQVLFYDPEVSSESMTFRDVFLRSCALENIVTSLVMETATEEETALVLDLFGLCMTGTREQHTILLQSVKELSETFFNYGELKLSCEDLLRIVADSITGLKFNPEADRLDASASQLSARFQQQLEAASSASDTPGEKDVSGAFLAGIKLAQTLTRTQSLTLQQGDDPAARTLKIEQMAQLSSALLGGGDECIKRISDCRLKQQDAIAFRTTKIEEVAEAEKAISSEMRELQKRREELEEELAQVMSSISTLARRHVQLQEEKEQFDLASSNLVARLSGEEETLSALSLQEKEDAKTLLAWQSYLEASWKLQSSFVETKDKDISLQLGGIRRSLLPIASLHVTSLKTRLDSGWDKLLASAARLRDIQARRESLEAQGFDGVVADTANDRRKHEEEYLLAEYEMRSAVAAAENAKNDLHAIMPPITSTPTDPSEASAEQQQEAEANAERTARLFQQLKVLDSAVSQFRAFPRPILQIEHPTTVVKRRGTLPHIPGSSPAPPGSSPTPHPFLKGLTSDSASTESSTRKATGVVGTPAQFMAATSAAANSAKRGAAALAASFGRGGGPEPGELADAAAAAVSSSSAAVLQIPVASGGSVTGSRGAGGGASAATAAAAGAGVGGGGGGSSGGEGGLLPQGISISSSTTHSAASPDPSVPAVSVDVASEGGGCSAAADLVADSPGTVAAQASPDEEGSAATGMPVGSSIPLHEAGDVKATLEVDPQAAAAAIRKDFSESSATTVVPAPGTGAVSRPVYATDDDAIF